MSSIERKGPLAANLRVQMPSSLHVVKTGLIKRSRCARAGTIRSRLRFAGGSSAFMTIHRRISRCQRSNP